MLLFQFEPTVILEDNYKLNQPKLIIHIGFRHDHIRSFEEYEVSSNPITDRAQDILWSDFILVYITLSSDVSNKEQQTLGQDIPFPPCNMHVCHVALCEFWYPFPSFRSNNTRAKSLSLHLMLASKAILAVLLLEVHFCQTEIKKRRKDISEEQELVEGSLCGQLVSTFRFNGKTWGVRRGL